MSRRKDYIESPRLWKELLTCHGIEGMWTAIDRVPIRKIKTDKCLSRDVDYGKVLSMLVNFDKESWLPMIVDKNYRLLDGQHRLKVAKQLCLKYVDVIVRGS